MKDQLIYIIRFCMKLNFFKTIFINFRLLPFISACHLPILIFGQCKLHHLKGRIVFNCPIKFGQLLIGISDPLRSYQYKTYISLLGTIHVENHVVLRKGLQLSVVGDLYLEDSVHIGDHNTIICTDEITIKKGTRVANDTTFMDTDFHYVLNTENREIKQNHAPIELGENCWIGGNCVIKKGTKLPKGTILIGPFSSVSKDLTEIIPENSLIGGSPAKLIRSGYRRVNSKESDAIIRSHFKSHNNPFILNQETDIESFCMPQFINSIRNEIL